MIISKKFFFSTSLLVLLSISNVSFAAEYGPIVNPKVYARYGGTYAGSCSIYNTPSVYDSVGLAQLAYVSDYFLGQWCESQGFSGLSRAEMGFASPSPKLVTGAYDEYGSFTFPGSFLAGCTEEPLPIVEKIWCEL